VLIMPLQSGTQWDALAHIFFEGKMYNGYDPDQVGSKGALKNDITGGCDRMIGRGVLLDVPAAPDDSRRRGRGGRHHDPRFLRR
jgi:hypothetical protein